MGVILIRNKDIDACPKQSLSPRHYNPDGSCRCEAEKRSARRLEVTRTMTHSPDDGCPCCVVCGKHWVTEILSGPSASDVCGSRCYQRLLARQRAAS